jgi:ribosomal protein S17E
MPTAAQVRIVNLRKWFPPHDPIAVKIARLCILREDLLIEMQGVYVKDIKELDESSPQSRRMYFLRNLIRTQTELSGAIQTLLISSEFKSLLDKAPKEIQEAFSEAAAIIGKAQPVAKDVRNDICGHVRESAVRAALERIDPDSWGFLDIGPRANLTHYKFAGELTAEILLKDVTKEERGTISSSKFATIANLVQTFALIEVCLRMYAQDRRLLPRRG